MDPLAALLSATELRGGRDKKNVERYFERMQRKPVMTDEPSVFCQLSAMELHSRITLLEDLPDEIRQHIFSQLCNALEPRLAVYFSSASHELWELTQALRQQLRTEHEAAAAMCHNMGMWSFKELREAMEINWRAKVHSEDEFDLATLGTLGSVLPVLKKLHLIGGHLIDGTPLSGPDGVQRLTKGLGAGALPAVVSIRISRGRGVAEAMHVGDAGASALAAALGRGALPQLQYLALDNAAIGDAGLVALAWALRRRPALIGLALVDNPLGDEGLAALVAPPPPAGAPQPPTGGLATLKQLYLRGTQVTDAGCAALVTALDRGALPALKTVVLEGTPASAAATAAVQEALDNLESRRADLVRSLRMEVKELRARLNVLRGNERRPTVSWKLVEFYELAPLFVEKKQRLQRLVYTLGQVGSYW